MASSTPAALLVLVLLARAPPALAAVFSAAGLGAAGAVPGLGAWGLGASTGGVSSAGTAAADGPHVASTLTLAPVGGGTSGAEPSPELALLPALGGLLSRPVAPPVPDYRDGAPAPKRVKRKVKHAAPSQEAPQEKGHRPPPVCWTLSKRCCYEEVHRGYECKDFYAYKYARCHPVIDYAETCDDVVEDPPHHPKPKGRTRWEETIIKNYDANYGAHVDGYPESGESPYYKSEIVPIAPHGVSGKPHPPPQQYVAPAPGGTSVTQTTTSSGEQYTAPPPRTGGNGGGDKYTAPPPQTGDNGGGEQYTAPPPQTGGEEGGEQHEEPGGPPPPEPPQTGGNGGGGQYKAADAQPPGTGGNGGAEQHEEPDGEAPPETDAGAPPEDKPPPPSAPSEPQAQQEPPEKEYKAQPPPGTGAGQTYRMVEPVDELA